MAAGSLCRAEGALRRGLRWSLLGLWGLASLAHAAVCEVPLSGGKVQTQAVACPGQNQNPVLPPAPSNGAGYVSQSLPQGMIAGAEYAISVTMRNSGTTVWSAAQQYRLGSQLPHDNLTWGVNRVELPHDVAPGQSVTFQFVVRAPSAPGTYPIQWQMLQEGVNWFGGTTLVQMIPVHPSTVIGRIDRFRDRLIEGWTCATGRNTPIDVHLYLGGPAGTGSFAGQYRADQASEQAVAAACQAGDGAYRFRIPVTDAMLDSHSMQGIYVHGVLPDGGTHALLEQSGEFRLPMATRFAVFDEPNVPATMTAAQDYPATLTVKNAGTVTWHPEQGYRVILVNDTWGVREVPLPQAVAPGQTVTIPLTLHAPLTPGPYLFSWGLYWQDDTRVFSHGLVRLTIEVGPAPPPTPPILSDTVVRRYVYDAHQQLCKALEPETGATVLAYDAAGHLAWSAGGQPLPAVQCDTGAVAADERVTRSYDANDRLLTLRFPDGRGDQVWSYTADGLPAQIVTENAAGGERVINRYQYNRRRLLVEESLVQPGAAEWTLRYRYDGYGHLAGRVYPSGLSVDAVPNALGQATQAGSAASAVRYHANGAVARFVYGNGVTHTATQNARQLPARIGDSGLLDLDHLYDRNGNPVAIVDNGDGLRGQLLGYDGRNRLVQAQSPMYGTASFGYDTTDNLRRLRVDGGNHAREYVYHYDADHRLQVVHDGQGAAVAGLSYDAQGNLSNKNGVHYRFDRGNRLREVEGRERYRYDGHGRRVWSETGGDGTAIVSFYDQGGVLRVQEDRRRGQRYEYVYLGGRQVARRSQALHSASAAEWHYAHTDVQGTPRVLTDASGGIVETSEYEPYGQLANRPVTDGPGYTGHVQDAATGLTYMQQRYYDPLLGRFLSVDPVAVREEGNNFNRYTYAGNNPYKFADPDGCEYGTAFKVVNDATNGTPVRRPDRTVPMTRGEKAIAGGLIVVAIPIVAVAGWEIGMTALANPSAVATVAESMAGIAGVTGVSSQSINVGRGATLTGLSRWEIQRIQNAADRTKQTINLVGSRATGTANKNSDWDYVINANAATRNSLSRSLPGAGDIKEGHRPNIDIFKGDVDRVKPFIEFKPRK